MTLDRTVEMRVIPLAFLLERGMRRIFESPGRLEID
jgi:hypothetical protein